jgi:hypothetical protein
VNWQSVTPADVIVGEDEAETKQLLEMYRRAEEYLRSFSWCPPVVAGFLGYGVGGAVAVFLFKVATKVAGSDDLFWVVAGDLPPAYLVTDDAPDPSSALTVYCDLMDAWATAVQSGLPLDGVFPVSAAATPKHAEMLLSRTRFIREKLLPLARGKVGS